MLKTSKFRRGLASSLAILFFACALTMLSLQFLTRPGWIAYDWLQKNSALPSTSGVAMVLVDQHTLDQMAKAEKISFPFPRQLYGIVNSIAAKAGARGILFDILFTETSSYGPADDLLFAKLIQDSKVPTFLPSASEKGFVKDPIEPLRKVVAGLGAVHFSVENDGIVRKAPPYLRGPNGAVMSLPEAVYQALGKPEDNREELFEIAPAERLLRFYSPKGIPFVSFYDLLLAYRSMENGNGLPDELQFLKDRVLVVGYSAPGLHDLKPLPTDPEAPGLLVPATALANRIDRVGIAITSSKTYLGLSFGMLALLLLAGSFARSPKLAALIVGVLSPVAVALATWLFWQKNFWLNPFPLALGLLAAGTSQLLLKFFLYWAERRKFAKSLAYSMSPEHVKLIRSGQLEVDRYGEQREITVFFCDIVGFSKISELMDPRQLVRLLNGYSDAAVELIVANGGYVDKFIGDAVMAFWGAPVPQLDHAARGLGVAIAYASTIEQFNKEILLHIPNFPGFKVRVGLHTGLAIVGNIGAKNRHNYTAIGDDVNLSSRLEGLAKHYHCFLLISESTVRAANALNRTDLIEIDHVIVRGRTQPTRLYTYLAPSLAEEGVKYSKALQLYYQSQWEQALTLFNQVDSFPAAQVMGRRCERALSEKSLNQWNQGVWYHENE